MEEGDYVLMQGRPCKIVEMSASRRNRHGHSKVHLVGIDIFTGKKFEDMSASTHEVEIPEVSRGEYRLVCILVPCMLLFLAYPQTNTDMRLITVM